MARRYGSNVSKNEGARTMKRMVWAVGPAFGTRKISDMVLISLRLP
jgi:hypothetical protein